jgi:hypothetical protein
MSARDQSGRQLDPVFSLDVVQRRANVNHNLIEMFTCTLNNFAKGTGTYLWPSLRARQTCHDPKIWADYPGTVGQRSRVKCILFGISCGYDDPADILFNP